MISCGICGVFAQDFESYNVHIRLHRDLKSVSFVCKAEDCFKPFAKYVQFARHINRNHYVGAPSAESNTDDKGNLVCCNTSFKTYNSYKSHRLRKHNNPRNQTQTELALNKKTNNLEINIEAIENENLVIEPDENKSTFNEACHTNMESIFEIQCGILFLTLLARHNVTNSAIQTIIHFLTEILEANNTRVCSSLLDIFSTESKSLIEKVFETDLLSKSFQLFKTEFFRKKYFKNNFDWVGFNTIRSPLKGTMKI